MGISRLTLDKYDEIASKIAGYVPRFVMGIHSDIMTCKGGTRKTSVKTSAKYFHSWPIKMSSLELSTWYECRQRSYGGGEEDGGGVQIN